MVVGGKRATSADKRVVALEAGLAQAKTSHAQLVDAAAQSKPNAEAAQPNPRDFGKRLSEAKKRQSWGL